MHGLQEFGAGCEHGWTWLVHWDGVTFTAPHGKKQGDFYLQARGSHRS